VRVANRKHAALIQLDGASRDVLSTCLEALGIRCHASARDVGRGDIDLAFLDGRARRDLIEAWIERAAGVVLLYDSDDDPPLESERVDWLEKPLRPRQVRQVVAGAIERARLRHAVEELRQRRARDLPSAQLIARSAPMRRLVDALAHAQASDRPVVLCGEPGSGRGFVARAAAGEVGHGVIEVNPSDVAGDRGVDALHEALGASSRETLLVRDVDRFSRDSRQMLTAALARAQRKLIVTTRAPLSHGDHESRERTLTMPPLRERGDDILPLARHFLAHYAPGARFTDTAEGVLIAYAWPMNALELRNTIERVALSGASEIGPDALPAHVFGQSRVGAYVGGDFTIAEVEQAHVLALVQRIPKMHDAAQILGVDDSTLWRMRKRHQLP
jgi:two-component system, NtrC family, response regulator AlgB